MRSVVVEGKNIASEQAGFSLEAEVVADSERVYQTVLSVYQHIGVQTQVSEVWEKVLVSNTGI